ncbi:MAG: carbohydrate ABC transporter permease [Anaerolineales bacterium]|nr:MAG: carbohydrate ABC transporter permease [Anaerolineales bacterium]
MEKLRSSFSTFFIFAGLILLSVFMMLPFIWMLSTSFKPYEEIFGMPPVLFSPNMSLDGYRFIFGEINALRALGNTALVSTAATAASLFFCTLGGYGFAKFRFPGRKILFSFLIGTMVVPYAIFIVPSYIMMVKYFGWFNTYLPLIIPGAANAFGIFFMRQYISTVNDEIMDAARIDGASEFAIFWRVILPIVRPGMVTLGLISFMATWNNYLLPSIYLKKQELFTLPLLMLQMQGPAGYTQYREWMALATISVVPLLILFLFFQRRFVEGITAGAVAGT